MPIWVQYFLLHASPQIPLAVEGFVLLLALALVWRRRSILNRALEGLEARFSNLARKQGLCVLLVFIAALSLRAAFLPLIPPGLPEVHDEFSYLLAADTFASGRLTNPTHPMWEHFETMHVIHQPTYQSKHPPAQGLILAAGTVLGGSPWTGVWVSCAIMCAALCWMLQGWLKPSWALLGALLIVVRFCTVHEWSTQYWGGAAAAIGGALTAGAAGRIIREGKLIHAATLGLGMAILANSRPFEGLLLSAAAGGVLLAWAIRQKRFSVRTLAVRGALPLFGVLCFGGALTAGYNRAVTGGPFTLPYQVHMKTYEAASPFFWQSPDLPKTYRHQALEDYWIGYHLQRVQNASKRPWAVARHRMGNCWINLLWPGLIWPLLLLPFFLRDADNRRIAFMGLSMVAAAVVVAQFYLHYLAPMLGVFYALILAGMARMRSWTWRGRPTGRALGRAIAAAWLLSAILTGCVMTLEASAIARGVRSDFRHQRAALQKELESSGEKHLVMVAYDPGRSRHHEWVYNKAGIDAAPVVWAREMDPERDRRLREYFPDRRVWRLEGGERAPRLVPFRETPSPTQTAAID